MAIATGGEDSPAVRRLLAVAAELSRELGCGRRHLRPRRAFMTHDASARRCCRRDIAPAGNVIWADIRASAISRPGDECHAGSYRQRLGPQLGDALAVATVSLRFVRP